MTPIENAIIDHAAELRGAIAQTRLVFEGYRDAQDALEYLEQVLKAGQRSEVPAHACEPADRAAAAMAAESAQLVIQAEKAAAGAAPRATESNDVRLHVDAASTPTTIAHLVVEVDTTQLDTALGKAEQLKAALTVLAPGVTAYPSAFNGIIAATRELRDLLRGLRE